MSLPSLPRLPRATKAPRPCSCGCGLLGPGRFRPGHDAILAAWVLRVRRGLVALPEIPHDGLRTAIAGVLAVPVPSAAKPKPTQAERKAAKLARRALVADPAPVPDAAPVVDAAIAS